MYTDNHLTVRDCRSSTIGGDWSVSGVIDGISVLYHFDTIRDATDYVEAHLYTDLPE